MASSSSRPSSYFLCNSDSLYYDDFIPAIEPEEILKADQIYFVLPVSKRHYRLTASDMAALAVKASVAMEKAVKNKNRRRKSGRISPVTMMNQPNERIVAVNRSSSTMMMQKGNLQNKTTQCFLSGGYLQVSEERLMTICSSEQMVEIRRTAVRLTKQEILHPLEVVDEVSSETDSSDEMEIFTPDADGMIRLKEVPTEQQPDDGLTLAIAPTNDVTERSSNKGKTIMTEPEIGGGQMFSLQMWSGSGGANTEGADANNEGAYTAHEVNAGDESDAKSYLS
ncbi:unnamed protein product [Brassica napus]|nr:unnamed protein product [Brassica napus]